MKLIVEKAALPYQLTEEILKKYSHFQLIEDYDTYNWDLKEFETLVSEGKKVLFLLEFKGEFVKACPGTNNYLCCGYQIFHIGEGCPLDCSYCILQLYLNRPGLKIWGNLYERGFEELINYLNTKKKKGEIIRIGTGEFTDSLALEHITHISENLIKLWNNLDPLALLELKTKIALKDDFFQGLKGNPRVIFAWSVNTDRIIHSEERATASLQARLDSARRAVKHGFNVAFHFDPIILYPSACEEYPLVLEKILNTIPARKIAWISFGTLRFPKFLKEIAQRRFKNSKIFSDEFITGLDQKKRYFIDQRKKLYLSFKKLINETKEKITYYFCMESERIWREVLDEEITNKEALTKRLDQVFFKLCSSS